jgi:zinc protease
MNRRRRLSFLWTALACIACQPTPPAPRPAAPPPPPVSTPPAVVAPDPDATPPPPALSPMRPFPNVQSVTLDNGLQLDLIERSAMPVVELALVVESGLASEGNRPAAPKITPEWLEAGGAGRWSSKQLRQAIDGLGTSLDIDVRRDFSSWSMAVTNDRMSAALEILSALVQAPRFDHNEFTKLRQRELERVRSLARTSGTWMAQIWLQRRLFRLPVGIHPYATYDVLPGELERLDETSCRGWFKEFVTPQNARLIAVGDVKLERLRQEVQRLFGRWRGPEVAAFNPSQPEAIEKFELFVVDRPSSTQSDIFLAFLGPNRKDTDFPAAATLQQVVGGGVAGRLFMDVREKRSLAYSTSAGIQELAKAPSVLYFAAGTQTPKTAETVGALLEHLHAMGQGSVSPEELATAQHYLIDSMPIRWEQVQSLASQLVQLRTLELPLDHFDTFRNEIAAENLDDLARTASKLYRREQSVVVIAGDAKSILPTLTKFGPVTRVDPSQNFRLREQLPQSP